MCDLSEVFQRAWQTESLQFGDLGAGPTTAVFFLFLCGMKGEMEPLFARGVAC